MNLTDYPTPRTNAFRRKHGGCWNFRENELLHEHAQLEREAAAWRSVAEALHTELDTAFNGYAGQYMRIEAIVTLDAFDALKSQLTQP